MSWTRERVQQEVLAILSPHAQNPEVTVTMDSHLVGDLGIDSLGVMEVLAELEDRFKITVPDEALREVETLADVARAVETRLDSEGRLES